MSIRKKIIAFCLITLVILVIATVATQSIWLSKIQSTPIINDILIARRKKELQNRIDKVDQQFKQDLQTVPLQNQDDLKKAFEVVKKDVGEKQVIAPTYDFYITDYTPSSPIIVGIFGTSIEENKSYYVFFYQLQKSPDGVYVIDPNFFNIISNGYTKPELVDVVKTTNLFIQPSPDPEKIKGKVEIESEKKIRDDENKKREEEGVLKKNQQKEYIKQNNLNVQYYNDLIANGFIKKEMLINDVIAGIKNPYPNLDGRFLLYDIHDDNYPDVKYILFTHNNIQVGYDDVKGSIYSKPLIKVELVNLDQSKKIILQ
jgi:hypothetical protein